MAAKRKNPTEVKLVGHIGLDVYRAGKAGALELVRKLIDDFVERKKSTKAFFTLDPYGKCPFGLWAHTGLPEILEIVRPHGIEWTPWTAAAWGQQEELERTLSTNPSALGETRWCGTPLHWAFAYSQVEIAKWIVATYPIDIRDTEGNGYVRCALRANGDDAVRTAVELGADVDFDPGETALQHQCKHGRTTCVSTLLELGADPNRPRFEDGRTSLHLAAATGIARKLLQLLLDAGADPHLRDKAGETAFEASSHAKRQTSHKFLEELLTSE